MPDFVKNPDTISFVYYDGTNAAAVAAALSANSELDVYTSATTGEVVVVRSWSSGTFPNLYKTRTALILQSGNWYARNPNPVDLTGDQGPSWDTGQNLYLVVGDDNGSPAGYSPA